MTNLEPLLPPTLMDLSDELERAAQRPVPTVLSDQCRRLGWPPAVVAYWEGLPDRDVAGAGWQAVVYRAARTAARAVDRENQLPYHNRAHAAEVLVAAGVLIAHDYPDDPAARLDEGLKLLAVMAAHDWGYHLVPPDAPKGQAEAYSAVRLTQALLAFGATSALIEELKGAVLGTEPTQAIAANAQALRQDPQNRAVRLRVLANEADLMASVLPTTGPARGQRLAQEWALRGVAGADTIASPQARQAFLRTVPLQSRAAQALGLPAVRDGQLPAPVRAVPTP